MHKYGIIGFGGLGKKHLSNLMKMGSERGDFCLSAICGTTLEQAKKGVELNLGAVDVSAFDFSDCNFYDDYEEMIETAKENKRHLMIGQCLRFHPAYAKARESISSTYHYDKFAVDTRADWSLPQTFPFKAICRVDFDEASVVVENDTLSVYKDNESFCEQFDSEEAFVNELKAFIELVIDSKSGDVTSPESVSDSVAMVLKEIDAAQKNKEVVM